MRDRKNDNHMKVVPAGPGQVRHHKDENKENNAPDNLEVQDRGAHTADHNKHRGLSKLRKSLSMPSRGEKLY